MARRLTQRQSEVLRLVDSYFERHNSSPTLKELASQLGISPQAVSCHIEALRRKGLLTSAEGKARSIFLTRWKEHVPGITLIPSYGETAYLSGQRRSLGDFNASTLLLDEKAEYFCLVMESANLINMAIRPGDRLIFRKGEDPRQGDLVIASLEGSQRLELRTWHRHGGKIILQAECDNIGNISCQSCAVHAILHAVVRFYG